MLCKLLLHPVPAYSLLGYRTPSIAPFSAKLSGYMFSVGTGSDLGALGRDVDIVGFLLSLQKCGYELQESKMLSLSTRHHDYGRQSRDDSQGYYSAFRGGGYEAETGAGGSGYGEAAQSGLGMFDRMNLGNDISEGDEDEESEEESSNDE